MKNLRCYYLVLGILTLLVVLPGCTKSETVPQPVAHVLKQYGQSTTSFEVAVGEQFEIDLSSNPSTGFSWGNEVYDTTLLKLVSKQHKPGGTAIGAPGTDIYTFQALKAGATQLKMSYRQVWDPSGPGSTTVTWEITIR